MKGLATMTIMERALNYVFDTVFFILKRIITTIILIFKLTCIYHKNKHILTFPCSMQGNVDKTILMLPSFSILLLLSIMFAVVTV